MRERHLAITVACAVVLVGAIARSLLYPLAACGQDIEVIRGTVEKLGPGSLALLDVTFPDGGSAGMPVMVILNDETEYFDGPFRATRDSVVPGFRVLVRCAPGRTGRVAVLVRIIGGTSPTP